MNKYPTPYGVVDLQIPELLDDPAIVCSGGADSTLILYLLILNGVIPTVVFMNNANSKYEALESVVSWLNSKFNITLKIVRWDRTLDTGHVLNPEIMLISRKFKYLWTGVTAVAPVVFPGEGAIPPGRPPADSVITWKNMIMPMIRVDKRVTAWLYSDLGIIDLFNLTYSCATNLQSPCNQCYNCLEREWAKSETT